MDENDIPMQKNACREFIAAMPHWVLEKEYTERGVSGYHKSASQRDVLQQVRQDAEKGLWQVLLVFMFDRLGRREDETPFIVEWFVSQGIEVWSVKEGRQTFENRTDKLLNYIRYWQSGGESEKTSIRVSEKHKQMVEEGKYRGGTPPYGYRLGSSGIKNAKGYVLKKVIIDEQEAEVVRTIFHLATAYGCGGYKIAKILNEQNITTRNGNLWTPGGVMSLLKNPLYKGLYISGRKVSERGHRRKAPPDDWHYAREIQTELIIVDASIWNKAEQIRSARKKCHLSTEEIEYPAQTKGPLLLVGQLSCGYCQSIMASRYAVKKWTQKKTGKEIRYLQPKYICQKRNAHILCTGPTTYSQKRIDPVLLEEVYLFFTTLPATDYTGQIATHRQTTDRRLSEELKKGQKKIEKIQKEIELLHTEIIKCLSGEGRFQPEQLNKILEQKQAELTREHSAMEALTEKQRLSASAPPPLSQPALIPDWCEQFDQAPVPIKKMLLAQLIEHVYIYRDRMDIHFRYSLPIDP